MTKPYRIFTKAEFAALPIEEKQRYYYLEPEASNASSVISTADFKAIKPFGVSRGLSSKQTAKEILLKDLQACADKAKPHEFTEEEIKCRMEFSDEICAKYFKGSGNAGDSDNLANFQKRDVDAYRRLKISAISRGYKLSPPRPVVQKQEPQSDGKFVLSADLARRASLPEGTKVDADQWAMILRLVNPEPSNNE